MLLGPPQAVVSFMLLAFCGLSTVVATDVVSCLLSSLPALTFAQTHTEASSALLYESDHPDLSHQKALVSLGISHLATILRTLGIAIFCATSAYFLCLWIYRVSLHPLARYPGPFLAKLTPWYDVYHAYCEDKHLLFHRLHEQYGTFVRYGPNSLSVNHPEALKAIYGHKANVRKSDFYLAFPAAPGVFSTHTAIDRKAHARKRRVMSHAFTENALRTVEDFVLEHVRDYIDRLTGTERTTKSPEKQNDWSKPSDVNRWSTYLGFDTMGDLAFGQSFGMLTGQGGENREAPKLLMQAAKRHNVTGPMPWLHQSGFDRLLFRKLNQDRDRYLNFSRSQVQQRVSSKAADDKRKDFFYYLLHAKDPETGEGFAKGEIWGESNTLIIAGSDTTSTTLTATIFYLLHNATCLEHLTQEIRSRFQSLEDIRSGPVLNSCQYLRCCIDEALRMSPPVGAILPRTVLKGGLNVLGQSIPEGTNVGTPIYAIHHHEDYVVKPFEYNPSRWLPSEAQEDTIHRLHSVFNPFSIGPRGCIGKPMAYMELSLALARLVWEYDMRLPPGDLAHVGEGSPELEQGRQRPEEFQMYDIFVSDKRGPFAQFRSHQK